ncbi:MAG: DUF2092 domain-containing protein [Burkholderiales bacterium]
MITTLLQRHYGGLAATALALAVLAGPALAQAPAAAEPPQAAAILKGMSEYLSKAPRYSVDVKDSYDVYQKSGQKIEFSENRKITMVRPDRLRIDVTASDGDQQVLTMNGKGITLATPNKNVYAQIEKAGSLDEAIVHFVRDLGMRLPFAALLISTASAEIAQRTQALDYVEKTSIYGVPAHHIAGRTESVDYQVWITDGDKPLPLRLVLTYRTAEGQPQFRAQFSNWNFEPQVPDSLFTFVPPQGAQRIAFLAQLPASAAPGKAKPVKAAKSGESK